MRFQRINLILLFTFLIDLIHFTYANQSIEASALNTRGCRSRDMICPIPYCQRQPSQTDIEAPGIGFSLEIAHSTAVVRHHNGTYQYIACIEAHPRHKEAMVYLIHAGRHPKFDSGTIETLGSTVQQLRQAVEDAGIDVTTAAMTIPEQIFLRYEEISTILDYASIQNVMYDPPIGIRASFQELATISAAYAGLEMGLCTDYLDFDKCDLQEHCLPLQRVLQIDLSTESLAGTILGYADTYWSSVIADTFVNTALGTNMMPSRQNEQEYWQAVRVAICELLKTFLPDKVDYLILTGTSVDNFTDPLRSAVRAAMVDASYQVEFETAHHIQQVLQPDHVVQHPIWTTAKGAAEIAKRRQERPFMCRDDHRTEEQRRYLQDFFKDWESKGAPEL